MPRIVFHIDMDAFFSSIEELSNPKLKGKPVIVCGDPYKRSVVSTASYEARRFGIKSGMPVTLARKLCPHGIFIRGDAKKYVYKSIQILKTLREFTPFVEPFSVDEAFLEFEDIDFEDAHDIGNSIKRRIREVHSLTCSIGIASNKIVAKMASDLNKPDGLTIIRDGEFLKFFSDFDVENLWGIGPKTSSKLKSIGIKTIGQLSRFSPDHLVKMFGEYGRNLWFIANGIDQSPVIPYFIGIEPKSIGHEYTLPEDSSDLKTLLSILLRLVEQSCRRLRQQRYLCDTVMVKIKTYDFKTITRQKKLHSPTDRDELIFYTARGLLIDNLSDKMIRLVGVSLKGLIDADGFKTDPIFPSEKRMLIITDLIDSIRDRFGEDSIKRCATIIR